MEIDCLIDYLCKGFKCHLAPVWLFATSDVLTNKTEIKQTWPKFS
jgi:hypothetical protein